MAGQLIVVSGRSGSGKSSVANEMSQQLRLRNIPHANIDGDNLDAMYPEPEGGDVLLANLEAMWTTYTRTYPGLDKLIVAGTAVVLHFEDVQRMIDKVGGGQGGVKGKAVVLTAGDETAAGRLSGREVGSELSQCLASSSKMAVVLDETVGEWAERVPTDGSSVQHTAMYILRQAGWILD